MSFLYGNHVLKTGVATLTQDTPKNQPVVVFNQSEIPLGFGVTARSSLEVQQANSTDLIVLNQADIGSYLRDEDHFVGCAL
jgi:60S ribosome subunit biogenesis protein NIP7